MIMNQWKELFARAHSRDDDVSSQISSTKFFTVMRGYSLARRSRGILRSARRQLHQNLSSDAQITTLPNKIRVATDPTPGHFSSVGLYVDAGSRYETPENAGASHFLDRMAFKVNSFHPIIPRVLTCIQSTTNRTDTDMLSAISSLGGQIMCSSSREAIMYQSSHPHKDTPLAVSLIADTVLNPAFLEEEIENQRDAAAYELREVNAKPEAMIPEVLHGVAYNQRGLGNSLMCPEERIALIDSNVLRGAMAEWYRPERMVIAGAGMPHEQLVELVEKHFSSLKPSRAPSPLTSRPSVSQPPSNILTSLGPPSMSKSLTRAASYLFPNSTVPPFTSSSTYTGGHKFIFDGASEFNHLYVAYEGFSMLDDDVYPTTIMQVLLGGGGSFSAGGPGKGMYSRLYTEILNHYAQIDHCASFNHLYNDSSLFGLFATFVPASAGPFNGNPPKTILPHLIHQLSLLLYKAVPAQELSRAKNQLKSSMMMALESQALQVEDLGRQVRLLT